jgi:hypothetical protein
MARAVVNAVRNIDLRWVRIEIGLLVGAICDPLVQVGKRMRAPKA